VAVEIEIAHLQGSGIRTVHSIVGAVAEAPFSEILQQGEHGVISHHRQILVPVLVQVPEGQCVWIVANSVIGAQGVVAVGVFEDGHRIIVAVGHGDIEPVVAGEIGKGDEIWIPAAAEISVQGEGAVTVAVEEQHLLLIGLGHHEVQVVVIVDGERGHRQSIGVGI